MADSFRRSVRALSHRNYRLFFAGQGISLIGSWMTRVASGWLVYRLTDDAIVLGFVSFAGLMPTFFLAPVAGVWVDRMNRHRLLIATQVFSAMQSFGLAAVAYAAVHLPVNTVIAWLIVLNIVQACINAFDMPLRQAFLSEMVTTRAHLPNAIALNSTMFHGARFIGPTIAGAAIAAWGETACFLIDAFSYVAVVAALMAMRVTPRPLAAAGAHKPRVFASMKDGFHYAFASTPIRAMLSLIFVFGFFGMPYTVLLPVFAKSVLHGGADTLGYLTAASGAGAVLGAVMMAARSTTTTLGRLMVIAGGIFAVGLVAFACSPWLSVSMGALVVVGFGQMTQMVAGNTSIQTIVEEDKRGRVMSLYTSAFMGSAPFGGLVAGWAAERIGAPKTLCLGVVPFIVALVYFARRGPAVKAALVQAAVTAEAAVASVPV